MARTISPRDFSTASAALARSGVPKSTSRKFPSLGCTVMPSAWMPAVSFARHWSLCAMELSTQPGSASAAMPAAIAGAFTLKGPRTRLRMSITAGGA